jgi:epidermal growth factor receptor substrate 15
MRNFIFFGLILLFSSFSFSQLDEQKKQEFSKKMKDADMLFSQGKFLEAKKYYEAAATLNPNDEQAKKQIKFCDANEQKKSGFEEDKEYNKLINKADEKFKVGDYQGAKDLFLRATKIKTSDAYPPKMLKQIDDLLNPKTVKTPDPLPDLGQNSEMSIDEAQKALKAADIARKTDKNTSVSIKSDAIVKNEIQLVSNRFKEIEHNNVNFSGINKRIDSINVENLDNMDTINVKLQHEDNSVSSVINFQQTYQRDLLGFVDRTLANKNIFNDSISLKNKQLGSTNDTIFFNRNVENDNIIIEDNINIERERAETKKSINIYESKQEKKIADNIITKQEVAELVTETNDKVQDTELKLKDKNKKNSENTVEKYTFFSKKEDSRITDNKKNTNGNQEFLVVKNMQKLTLEDSLLISPEKRRNNLNDSLKEIYYKDEFELNNKINSAQGDVINQVNASKKVFQNEVYDLESSQQTNRQDHVVSIVQLELLKYNVEDSLSKIVNTSGEKLNILTKKNQSLDYEINDSEIKELNNSALGLVKLDSESSRYNGLGYTKPSEAKITLENIGNTIEKSKTSDAENRTRKTLENKNIIEDIEKKGKVFDDKAANDIGSIYPEGVTQEQFNKTDDKGSLLAVVTRRIIVKNGYGQIYTRTQSKDFITYSKNGAASTEAIWQKETQDAKLKKN